MRGYTTLVEEAQALAMSPDAVHSFLKQRTSNPQTFGAFGDAFDKQAEAALLARADPLIDLSLAQYGRHNLTARELWAKATPESPVRLAILSNRLLQAELFNSFPTDLLGDAEKTAIWLEDAMDTELHALLENPVLDDRFLTDLLNRAAPYDRLADTRFLEIVSILSRNMRLRTTRQDDFMDGYAEYRYSSVFDAAWRLAESVPSTNEWAGVLGWLYMQLEPEAFSIKDPMALTQRWESKAAQGDGQMDESAVSTGSQSSRQRVRMGLAKLALTKEYSLLPKLLASNDPGLRCAAYGTGRLMPDDLQAAYDMDGELAFDNALPNPWYWRQNSTRTKLKEIAWAVVSSDKHSDLQAANQYEYMYKEMRKAHPEWFEDEDEDAATKHPANLPATRADLESLSTQLGQPSSRQTQLLEQIQNELASANSRMGWIWWFSLGALAASLWRN